MHRPKNDLFISEVHTLPNNRKSVTLSLTSSVREATLLAKLLMLISAAITFTLGAMHLLYTFSGTLLTPRDPALQIAMTQIAPVITKQTTMWRCWIGFNATHSIGLILFGLIFGYLAATHSQLLFQSWFLLLVGAATLCGYVAVSKAYFFSSPLIGISIALACFIAAAR